MKYHHPAVGRYDNLHGDEDQRTDLNEECETIALSQITNEIFRTGFYIDSDGVEHFDLEDFISGYSDTIAYQTMFAALSMETRDFMKHINITRENLRLAIVNKIYEKDYVQALAEFIEEFGDHDHE